MRIRAYDHGDEDEDFGAQESFKTYQLLIKEYNFDAPRITFPVDNQQIRLRLNNQRIGFPLYLIDDTELKPFEAIDTDGGIFGKVHFEIKNTNDEDDLPFSIETLTDHTSELQLIRRIENPGTYLVKFIRLKY